MDYFDRFAAELKNEKRPVYFFGAGFIAKKVTSLLEEKGFSPEGYIVDPQYIPMDKKSRFLNGKPIISANEICTECALVDAIQLKFEPISLPNNKFIKKVYRLDLSIYIYYMVHTTRNL